MIWATVSSWSCFCWPYRASPSLAAKNIINLISLLTICWCPCVVFSYVVGRGCLLWPVHSLGKTLLLCPASVCTSRPNLPVTPGISCFPTFIPVPYDVKDIFFLVLVLEGLVGLHRPIQLQLLWCYRLGHRLGLLWYWMVSLETIRDHCIIFEIAPKFGLISDSLVDCEGYSISSKGFLPTVIDIMAIWIKFAHSSPF